MMWTRLWTKSNGVIEWEDFLFPLTTTLMKGKIMSETKPKYLQIRDELQKFSDENYDDLMQDEFEIQNHWLARLTQAIEKKEWWTAEKNFGGLS